jgi:hypothetical protein
LKSQVPYLALQRRTHFQTKARNPTRLEKEKASLSPKSQRKRIWRSTIPNMWSPEQSSLFKVTLKPAAPTWFLSQHYAMDKEKKFPDDNGSEAKRRLFAG